MSRIEPNEAIDAAEEVARDVLANGATRGTAVRAAGAFLETLDNIVPVIDRALSRDDYERLVGNALDSLTDKERHDARVAFRDEYEATRLPAMVEKHGDTPKATRKARDGWRAAWRRAEVSS